MTYFLFMVKYFYYGIISEKTIGREVSGNVREVMNLNFGWRFSPNFRQEYIRNDFKDNILKIVDIPHTPDDVPSFDGKVSRSGAGFSTT